MKLIRLSAIFILAVFLCAVTAMADGQTRITTEVPEVCYRLDIVIIGKGNVMTERGDFDKSSCIMIPKGESPEIIIRPLRGWYVEKITLAGETITVDENGGRVTLGPMKDDMVLSVEFRDQRSPHTGDDCRLWCWLGLAFFGLFGAVCTITDDKKG